MLPERAQGWMLGLRLAEAAAVVLAAAIAYLLRFHSGWIPVTKGIPPFSWYAGASIVAVGYQQILFQSRGWYHPRSVRRPPSPWTWLAAAGAIGFLFAASTFFLRSFEFSRTFFALWISVLAAALLVLRSLFVAGYQRSRIHRPETILLVGDAQACRQLERRLRRSFGHPIEIVGRAGDEVAGRDQAIGPLEEIPRLVSELEVRRVVVATAGVPERTIRRIVRSLDQELVAVDLVLDLDRLSPEPYRWEIEDGLGRVVLQGPPLSGSALAIKRAFDVVGASLALILTGPIQAAIAIAIRLSSPGPVLYRQERVSLDGRRFEILKFRTMEPDAEDETGPVFAHPDDPRTHRLGRFLRSSSLDELPQLWNVLRGQMSLVGPRPERPHFVDGFRSRIPRYAQRHWLRSGLTGWAQVNGWRGNSSMRKRIQYDLYYLRHWSLWFDLRILWLTVTRSFFGRNAY